VISQARSISHLIAYQARDIDDHSRIALVSKSDDRSDLACNGTLVKDEELGAMIQLQGDQRINVAALLVQEVGTHRRPIKLRGC